MSKKDENINFKKIWKFEPDNAEDFSISSRNSIGLIDNLFFAVGSKNNLYQYEPEVSQNNANKLCQTNDGSNISCIETYGESSLELQKIIFCSEKGEIHLYDQRMHKIALNKKLTFDKGKPNCIREMINENNTFYIGTSGGKLLKYDLRFNSISSEFQYYDNAPILGIYPFQSNKCNLLDPGSSVDVQNKYFIIWTASNNHEIGFWNCISLNCDLLLKVNAFNLNSFDVELPMALLKTNSIKNISSMKYNFIPNIENLKKYTYIYYNNYIKSLSINHCYDDFYSSSFTSLSNTLLFAKSCIPHVLLGVLSII